MKKVLKIAYAIALFIILNTVSAAELTIKDALCQSDSPYLFYRILNENPNKERLSVDYSWTSFFENGEGKNLLTLDNLGYITSYNENADLESIAKSAYTYAEENSIKPTYSTDDEDVTSTCSSNELKITINNGYYLIKSPKGKMLILMQITEDAVIDEKNQYSDAIVLVKNGDNYMPATGANIGSNVEFAIEITLTPGTSVFSLEDNPGAGIAIDTTSIKVDGCDPENYNIKFDGLTEVDSVFGIDFSKEYLEKIKENQKVTITFNAKYTKDAKDLAMYYLAAKNHVSYIYREEQNVPLYSSARVYSWRASVESFYRNSSNSYASLPGVHYIISKNADGSNPIKVVKEYDGGYRIATEGEESTTDLVFIDENKNYDTAYTSVYGLEAGTYYFIPTSIPLGFSLITESPIQVEISPYYDEEEKEYIFTHKAAKVEYTNESFILPKTGGMGTTLLITIGLILFIIPLGVIITKLKNENN